jgi:hypothetical protein
MPKDKDKKDYISKFSSSIQSDDPTSGTKSIWLEKKLKETQNAYDQVRDSQWLKYLNAAAEYTNQAIDGYSAIANQINSTVGKKPDCEEEKDFFEDGADALKDLKDKILDWDTFCWECGLEEFADGNVSEQDIGSIITKIMATALGKEKTINDCLAPQYEKFFNFVPYQYILARWAAKLLGTTLRQLVEELPFAEREKILKDLGDCQGIESVSEIFIATTEDRIPALNLPLLPRLPHINLPGAWNEIVRKLIIEIICWAFCCFLTLLFKICLLSMDATVEFVDQQLDDLDDYLIGDEVGKRIVGPHLVKINLGLLIDEDIVDNAIEQNLLPVTSKLSDVVALLGSVFEEKKINQKDQIFMLLGNIPCKVMDLLLEIGKKYPILQLNTEQRIQSFFEFLGNGQIDLMDLISRSREGMCIPDFCLENEKTLEDQFISLSKFLCAISSPLDPNSILNKLDLKQILGSSGLIDTLTKFSENTLDEFKKLPLAHSGSIKDIVEESDEVGQIKLSPEPEYHFWNVYQHAVKNKCPAIACEKPFDEEFFHGKIKINAHHKDLKIIFKDEFASGISHPGSAKFETLCIQEKCSSEVNACDDKCKAIPSCYKKCLGHAACIKKCQDDAGFWSLKAYNKMSACEKSNGCKDSLALCMQAKCPNEINECDDKCKAISSCYKKCLGDADCLKKCQDDAGFWPLKAYNKMSACEKSHGCKELSPPPARITVYCSAECLYKTITDPNNATADVYSFFKFVKAFDERIGEIREEYSEKSTNNIVAKEVAAMLLFMDKVKEATAVVEDQTVPDSGKVLVKFAGDYQVNNMFTWSKDPGYLKNYNDIKKVFKKYEKLAEKASAITTIQTKITEEFLKKAKPTSFDSYSFEYLSTDKDDKTVKAKFEDEIGGTGLADEMTANAGFKIKQAVIALDIKPKENI